MACGYSDLLRNMEKSQCILNLLLTVRILAGQKKKNTWRITIVIKNVKYWNNQYMIDTETFTIY